MEISGSEVFHRFLFIRSIHKRVGEQNLLCNASYIMTINLALLQALN